jgi:predicted PP-loop superfamily ATPase
MFARYVLRYQKKNEKIDWDSRQKSLDKLINNFKGKNNYDCIVPFSGGKDSVFALWYLVKKKQLKPLVVRFDHTFLRNTVQENTYRIIKKLGVDFINFTPNFNVVKKLMLESLFRRGDFCWHCHVGIAAFPIKIAIEKKIPLIFYGEPSAEYSSFYSYDDFEELDVEKFNKTINLGINAEDMLGMINERDQSQKFKIEDLDPYIFPNRDELIKNNIKEIIFLGTLKNK